MTTPLSRDGAMGMGGGGGHGGSRGPSPGMPPSSLHLNSSGGGHLPPASLPVPVRTAPLSFVEASLGWESAFGLTFFDGKEQNFVFLAQKYFEVNFWDFDK